MYGDYLVPGADPKVRLRLSLSCKHRAPHSLFQRQLRASEPRCQANAVPHCATRSQQVYRQVADLPGLVKQVEGYLEDYNPSSTSPMKLVLFLDAIEHVSRICRIIRQPLGHALLLGVGGSGRQSLARLAAFMCDFQVVQIEVSKGYGTNEWRQVWPHAWTCVSCVHAHMLMPAATSCRGRYRT